MTAQVGFASMDTRVVDDALAGVVLRRPGRVVRLRGRNGSGCLVAHLCDRSGRDFDPLVVELVDPGTLSKPLAAVLAKRGEVG